VTIRTWRGIPPADLAHLVVANAPEGTDGFMTHRERQVLVALANWVLAETVVEIGVQLGQCAKVLIERVPTIKAYYGVDVLPGYMTHLAVQQKECPGTRAGEMVCSDERFHLVASPRGSLDLTPDDLPTCDMMLIDGDHGEAVVRHDSNLAWGSVRFGGLIVWHDYWPPFENTVCTVIHDSVARGHDIRHIDDTWLAMEVR
jgi:hypothetical protein